jgi:hypothetical protein
MASQTTFQPMPQIANAIDELKFFSLEKEKNKIVKVPKKEKSVDDILDSITSENSKKKTQQTVLPRPSTEDWLSDENAPANLKNLPKPSDDADWLQDF